MRTNKFVGFVFGKFLAVAGVATAFLAIAKQRDVFSLHGYVSTIVEGYTEVVQFIFSFFDWFRFDWFHIDDIEKNAISLILIISGGVGLWFKGLPNKLLLAFLTFIITTIVFGLFVAGQTVSFLYWLFGFVFIFPLLLAFQLQRTINLGIPSGLSVFGYKIFSIPFAEFLVKRLGKDSFDFFGLAALKIKSKGIQLIPNAKLLTRDMVIEYLVTVFAAIFLILFLYLAGLVVLLT